VRAAGSSSVWAAESRLPVLVPGLATVPMRE